MNIDKSMKVAIATPFYENKAYVGYIRCLLDTKSALDYVGIKHEWFCVQGDSYVDRAKNSLAMMFIESDCTDLFMIDSDMEWDIEGFLRVLVAPYQFVAGVYPLKNMWEQYGCSIKTNNNGTPKCTTDGLIESDFVPGGFIRLKKQMLVDMGQFYGGQNFSYIDSTASFAGPTYNFFSCSTHNCVRTGEDYNFCRKYIGMGGNIYIEPRIKFKHSGIKAWEGCYHDFLLNQPQPVSK